MARLVIVVDVDGIDVTLVDPHDVADAVLDVPRELGAILGQLSHATAEFRGAEWERDA